MDENEQVKEERADAKLRHFNALMAKRYAGPPSEYPAIWKPPPPRHRRTEGN